MKTRQYTIKRLITGYKIGQQTADDFIAVPSTYRGSRTVVKYGNDMMVIEDWDKAVKEQTFKDKFQRDKEYTLVYFKWDKQ